MCVERQRNFIKTWDFVGVVGRSNTFITAVEAFWGLGGLESEEKEGE